MSITRAQAQSLAEEFYEDIGSDDKGELQPKETFTELFLLAGELVEDAQENLKSSQSNASGGLSESIQILDPTQSGNVVSCSIEMLFYGKFVNSGVRGTKEGTSTAGYAFKTEYPNKKMALSLLKGIRLARNSTRNSSKSKTVSGNEAKNFKISEIEGKRGAYGAARNIKMYGIKPTGFMDKAIKTATDKADERLGAALKIDVINSLNDFENKK